MGRLVFAVNGHFGNFMNANTILIVDGKIIAKPVPGMEGISVDGLEGEFYFFVLDSDKKGDEGCAYG